MGREPADDGTEGWQQWQPPSPAGRAPAKPSSARWWVVAVALLVALAGGAIFFAAGRRQPVAEPASAPTSTPASVVVDGECSTGHFDTVDDDGNPGSVGALLAEGTVRNPAAEAVHVVVIVAWGQVNADPLYESETLRVDGGATEAVRMSREASTLELDRHTLTDGTCEFRAEILSSSVAS